MPNRKSHTSAVPSGNSEKETDVRNQKSMSTSRKKEESNVKRPQYKNEVPADEQMSKEKLSDNQGDRGNLE